ncbi:immunity 63 family protein [Hymenobacter coalescens]
MHTLPELKYQVEALAARIRAPAWLLPTYGFSEDGARPHLEADGHGLHYVVVERGQEQERRTTTDADELLYWVFQSVTFSMACDYEVRHRVPGQDFRRLLFQEQLRLLAALSPAWATRCAARLKRTLRSAPYDDSLG